MLCAVATASTAQQQLTFKGGVMRIESTELAFCLQKDDIILLFQSFMPENTGTERSKTIITRLLKEGRCHLVSASLALTPYAAVALEVIGEVARTKSKTQDIVFIHAQLRCFIAREKKSFRQYCAKNEMPDVYLWIDAREYDLRVLGPPI